MKVTMAQLNPVVGDVEGNMAQVVDTLRKCSGDAPDLVIFPELFLMGYPPRDLLERRWFVEKSQRAIQELRGISQTYPETGILLGTAIPTGEGTGKGLYNSALLIYRGQVLFRQNKSLLPSYDVFDESRYFDPAPKIEVFPFKNEVLGISICEDAWNDPEFWPRRTYPLDPIAILAKKGATLLVNISASPFHVGKEEIRHRLLGNHARKHALPVVFVNQIGANDELIFDGRSLFVNSRGDAVLAFPPFNEHLQTIETTSGEALEQYTPQERVESVHQALVLGIRDYARKCSFSKVTLGLSGGIDSSLTCCLARAALGGENVLGVSMPSPYSSQGSVEDSRKLAQNLGVQFRVIPISDIYATYLASLKEHFKRKESDVTEENIQARIRGNLLMALSNKFGYLVLSSGNKSEVAVGYCTLYGDMSGGLSVLSDVPKTMVYELARYVNRAGEVIPKQIIEKPPSAELKPDQRDQDTLPPYEVLDPILRLYVDDGRSAKEIIDHGFEPEVVTWVIRAVDRNEYKRRQAAPGLKVTSKAFGMGRRMPIAAKYNS
ncbi:MAG: NAD synthetase [candidate division Zixibacteria bacterium SM23_81]|nr:MAG: NAD synthetase [candidate division Zixibacteria bacterium SM23_81]